MKKFLFLIPICLIMLTGCGGYSVDDLCCDYDYGYGIFEAGVSNCAYGHGNDSFDKDIVNLSVTYDIYDSNYDVVETITVDYDPIKKDYKGIQTISTKYSGLIQKVEATKATFELK